MCLFACLIYLLVDSCVSLFVCVFVRIVYLYASVNV